jgi:hypothetical protein
MTVLSKIPLSGSTNGRGIAVAATAIGSGTTLHTANAVTGAGQGDELVLYAANIDTVAHTLTIGFGGTTTADTSQYTIQPGLTVQVMAGLIIQNSLVVAAAADVTNKINIFGFAIRSV